MGKIYGICDFRRGKIGDLVFRKVADKNIVSEKANYYPVNSAWLKKQEFKNYVLSLLNEGIPQVYVLNELPEEIYPYALIFIQNQGGTSIYVDKDGVRTKIELGEGSSDAVDIVDEIPGEPRDNTIYFVNNPESKNKNIPQNVSEYDLYVCENNELKQITLKGEDNPYVIETIDNLTSKSLKNVYNQVLPANKNVITDANGYLTTGNGSPLYCHSWKGIKNYRNCVNAVFYKTNNISINGNNVYDILEGLNCYNYIHYYPATGIVEVSSHYYPVIGIFMGNYSTGVRGAMWTYIGSSGLQSFNPVGIQPTFTDTIMAM